MSMNTEQIACARQEKKLYLLSVLLTLIANAGILLVDSVLPNDTTFSTIARASGSRRSVRHDHDLALCRAIGIGPSGR